MLFEQGHRSSRKEALSYRVVQVAGEILLGASSIMQAQLHMTGSAVDWVFNLVWNSHSLVSRP